jgi:hypothetical protein
MGKRRKNPITGKPMATEDELRHEPLMTRIAAAIVAKHTFPHLLTPSDAALLAAIDVRAEELEKTKH